jgi:hypothetical protein
VIAKKQEQYSLENLKDFSDLQKTGQQIDKIAQVKDARANVLN